MWHSGVYNNKRTFSLEAALLISWQADGANRFQVQGVKESCGWRGRKKGLFSSCSAGCHCEVSHF